MTQTPIPPLKGLFIRSRHIAGMRLMMGIFAVVVLILVDQMKFYGHYTRETARVTRYVIAQVGL